MYSIGYIFFRVKLQQLQVLVFKLFCIPSSLLVRTKFKMKFELENISVDFEGHQHIDLNFIFGLSRGMQERSCFFFFFLVGRLR
jgi:hypothetical protein